MIAAASATRIEGRAGQVPSTDHEAAGATERSQEGQPEIESSASTAGVDGRANIEGAFVTFENELHELIEKGPVADLFRAEESYSIIEAIGEHADQINERNFGHLFSSLQQALAVRYSLSACKIFEAAHQRYPNRSLPSVLAFLKNEAPRAPLRNPGALVRFLYEERNLVFDPKAGSQLTLEFVAAANDAMPNPSKATSCPLSRALESTKILRDKHFAHNEIFDPSTIHKAPFSETQQLLAFAKRILGAIGLAYLGVAYTASSDDYILDGDAQRTGAALRRLLNYAGLAPRGEGA